MAETISMPAPTLASRLRLVGGLVLADLALRRLAPDRPAQPSRAHLRYEKAGAAPRPVPLLASPEADQFVVLSPPQLFVSTSGWRLPHLSQAESERANPSMPARMRMRFMASNVRLHRGRILEPAGGRRQGLRSRRRRARPGCPPREERSGRSSLWLRSASGSACFVSFVRSDAIVVPSDSRVTVSPAAAAARSGLFRSRGRRGPCCP